MQYYNNLDRLAIVTSYNRTNIVDGLFNPVLFEQTLFVDGFSIPDNELDFLSREFLKWNDQMFSPKSLKELESHF